MKKLLTFSLFILFLAVCDKDPASTNNNYLKLSPPSWIIGTWSSGLTGFTFNSNDVICHMGDSTFSFVETFGEAPLTDVSSDIMYKVIIGDPGTAYVEYLFDKITSDSLNYTNDVGGMVVGPVGMTKQ